MYPIDQHPTRPAYVNYKNLKSGKFYCRFGKSADGTSCKPTPSDVLAKPLCSANVTTGCATAEERSPYDPSVLSGCVCTGGTYCKSVNADAGVASVASTIFMRVAMGGLLERFGPVNTQMGLLLFGSIWVFAACFISAPWNYGLIRFMIGACGATFVTNQFWCSLMFAPNIVGTANATAAGWGNLGGGVTQVFMVVVLFQPFQSAGMEPGTAWRVSMIVPGCMFLICAACIRLLCWDTPLARRFTTADTGKTSKASVWDYWECLK